MALCLRSHPLEGHTAMLTQRSHGVTGTAFLKDACTLELRGFSFDGEGIDVQVYLAKYPDWEGSGLSVSGNLVRDQPYAGVTLSFALPLNLPDFDGCTIALRDFDFDGAGFDVQVYLGFAKDNFATGFSISGNLVRETPYSQAMLTLLLPDEPADFGALSIWCVTFGVDFGSGTFMNASSLLPPPSPPPPPVPSC